MPNWSILRVVVVLTVGGISACFYRIFTQVRREIHEIEAKVMAKLDNITAEVAATKGAEQSAVVLLGQLKDKLDAAIAAQGEDDGAALQALSDDLGASRAALAAAVVANTPAADGATSSAHPDNAPPPAPPAPAEQPEQSPSGEPTA